MAAALGLGLTSGAAVVSLGTSGTAFTRSERQTHDPTGTVAGFADATGAFLPLVCTLNAARNVAGTASLLNVSLDQFAGLALSAPPGSEGLAFVPYFEGERTPPLPDATGELIGVTLRNFTPANVARGVRRGGSVEPRVRAGGDEAGTGFLDTTGWRPAGGGADHPHWWCGQVRGGATNRAGGVRPFR
jgi:xylulokinase